jgi:hypothetical protein
MSKACPVDAIQRRPSRKDANWRNTPGNFVNSDPDDILVVSDLGYGAGAGVVARRAFRAGDLIVIYRGVDMPAPDDEKDDETNDTTFKFKFVYTRDNEKRQIDASDPTSGIGRFINDMDAHHPANAVAKRIPGGSVITINAVKTIEQGKCLQINPGVYKSSGHTTCICLVGAH